MMWDQRYSSDSYAYGIEPNDFLKEKFYQLPIGSAGRRFESFQAHHLFPFSALPIPD